MKIRKEQDPIYLKKQNQTEAQVYIPGTYGNLLPEAEVVTYTGTEKQQERKKRWYEFLQKWDRFKKNRQDRLKRKSMSFKPIKGPY
jgi:hypothetical protein